MTALQITMPTDTTIVLTRSFKAPPRLVYEAMSTPAKMKLWMLPPPGMTLVGCEVDRRLGGKLKLTWSNAETNPFMTLEGEWTEWNPSSRMVHTEIMKLGSGQTVSSLVEAHEFSETAGGTLMVITQTYESKEARDEALASGMDQGMEACYQTLDGLLAH